MKAYLTGGWGYGNKGDNAIYEAMTRSLKKEFPGITFAVTSFSTDETKKQHQTSAIPSIHYYLTKKAPLAIPRWAGVFLWFITGIKSFLSPALRTHLDLISKSDIVIMGGGGYFNDAWIDMLLSRYVEIEMAHQAKTPIVIYGQTVGPFGKKWMGPAFRYFMQKLSGVAYRDRQSLAAIIKSDYPKDRTRLTADEVNLMPVLGDSHFVQGDEIAVGVMIQKLRPHLGPDGPSNPGRITNEGQYVSEVAEALLKVAKSNKRVVYHFIPSTTWDEATCRAVHEKVANDCASVFYSDPDVDQFMRLCQSVSIMVSTNMHPIILAATNGKPSVGLSYHYKLDDYMSESSQRCRNLRIDDFSAKQLAELIIDTIERPTKPETKTLMKMAEGNVEIVKQALKP